MLTNGAPFSLKESDFFLSYLLLPPCINIYPQLIHPFSGIQKLEDPVSKITWNSLKKRRGKSQKKNKNHKMLQVDNWRIR